MLFSSLFNLISNLFSPLTELKEKGNLNGAYHIFRVRTLRLGKREISQLRRTASRGDANGP